MPRGHRIHLPFDSWPAEDKTRWQAAFKAGDRFDGSGPGSHLAESSRRNRRDSYARFLGFLSANRRDLLQRPPDARVDRLIVADYVEWRRRSCGEVMVAADLHELRGALRLICPDVDWSWLLTIAKRIAAMAPRVSRKYHLVTSERLYALGIELMDHATAAAEATAQTSQADALKYRDGLAISLLALIPLRRRTLVALCVDRHLMKTGNLWALDIPAADTKTRRPLDYPIPKELCTRIDLYLERFPMCAKAIYDAVRNRTKKAFGFGINLHRFRHAAATFWSIRDPVNVRGAKDLLGQASFGVTEKHYIMAQSRLAGRALANAVDAARK